MRSSRNGAGVSPGTTANAGWPPAAITHNVKRARPFENMAAHRRQLEIQAWLNGHGRSDAEWVALDDWPSSFEAGFARLVLTDPTRAFDQDWFQELRSHFLRFANER